MRSLVSKVVFENGRRYSLVFVVLPVEPEVFVLLVLSVAFAGLEPELSPVILEKVLRDLADVLVGVLQACADIFAVAVTLHEIVEGAVPVW